MPPFFKPPYRRAAIAFAGSLFFVCLVGNLFISPSYQASTLLTLSKEGVQDEWALLRDENQEVDLEEQAESRAVLEPALNKLGLLTPEASPQVLTETLERFRKDLTVERIKHSNILRITFTSPNPLQAATQANAVAESLLKYFRDRTIRRTEGYLQTLDKEVETVRDRLKTQTELRDQFLSAHQLNSYEAELQLAQQRVAALQSALRSTETTLPTDDPSLQELVKEVAAAQARLSHEESRYKQGSPLLLQAKSEKENVEQILRQRLNERRQSLEHLLQLEEDRFNNLREVGPQIQLWEASIAHEQHRYQDLLTEQAKNRLLLTLCKKPSSTSTFGSLAILDEALPPSPSPGWSRFLLNQLGAVCLSLLGFFLTPLLLKQWESKSPQINSLDPEDPDMDIHHEIPSGRLR